MIIYGKEYKSERPGSLPGLYCTPVLQEHAFAVKLRIFTIGSENGA